MLLRGTCQKGGRPNESTERRSAGQLRAAPLPMCCSADVQSDASKDIEKMLREEVALRGQRFNLLLLGMRSPC